MKTRIKKVIMIAAALLFLSSGAAFAQDRNSRHVNHDKRWNSLGQYKKAPSGRPYRNNNNFYGRNNYGNANRHFYQRHYQPKKYHQPHPYYRHQKRYPQRDTFFFRFSVR
jgi:hypothetical protein